MNDVHNHMNSDNVLANVIHALVLYKSDERVPLSVKDIRSGTCTCWVGHCYCLPVWCQETETLLCFITFNIFQMFGKVFQVITIGKGSLFLLFLPRLAEK